jgi:hypothetical protein
LVVATTLHRDLIARALDISPNKTNGYPFESTKHVRVANPVSFLSQKILIQDVRDRKDRAKDILYIHDTIEIFAGHLIPYDGHYY